MMVQPSAGAVTMETHVGEAGGLDWQVHGTSDVSELLRRMNAERMHLEQSLSREEDVAVHKLLKETVRRLDATLWTRKTLDRAAIEGGFS